MDASPIFPLTLLLFFPGGLTLQSFEAVRSSEPFTLLLYNRPNDGALATSSIRRIIKRAMRRAGLDDAVARELSGHSMRIGAAQDMMAAGFDALAIMQAGGWNLQMSSYDMSSMRQHASYMKSGGGRRCFSSDNHRAAGIEPLLGAPVANGANWTIPRQSYSCTSVCEGAFQRPAKLLFRTFFVLLRQLTIKPDGSTSFDRLSELVLWA